MLSFSFSRVTFLGMALGAFLMFGGAATARADNWGSLTACMTAAGIAITTAIATPTGSATERWAWIQAEWDHSRGKEHLLLPLFHLPSDRGKQTAKFAGHTRRLFMASAGRVCPVG